MVPSECNLHLPHLDDDDSSAPQVIQSWVPLKGEKLQGEHASTLPMHTIAPDELIDHSILLPFNEEGEHYHVKIVQKIIAVFENMFGEKQRPSSSPLEKNDCPEMDVSTEVDPDMITKYQSMLGALQWVISLGRFDICTGVMTMSRFHVAP